MPTAEDDDDRYDISRVPMHLRAMELHDCGPGRAGHPNTGEPIVILKFVWKRRLEQPIMLKLNDARRLLAKLVAVLDHYDDALGKKLSVLFFPGGEWPTDMSGDLTNPRPKPRHLARPSVRPNALRRPLNDTDVWHLVSMLRHVDNHETFMRFIGVPEADFRTNRQTKKNGATSKLHPNRRAKRPIKKKR